MSQRKLNRRQAWRAEKIQAERSARSQKEERNLSRQVQSGLLSSEQTGLVICRYSKHFEIEAMEGQDQGEIHKCTARTNLGSIVAGDQVTWRAGSDGTGVIEARLERRSILERPDNFGKLKPVAANIDQMLIVIACEPTPQINLIDRYLVAAELMHVRPIIVLNKADLLNDQNSSELNALLEIYQSLGYHVEKIISSRHQPAELADLPSLIDQRTSIVVGQSGVGKSSFINTLLPEANLAVGDLSTSTREGTHTTTQAKLFHLPCGGQLIDSPGIRDFSLWHIDPPQLQQGFIEIAALLGQCRFRDCKHEHEPGCAILLAAEQETIHPLRFESYERIKAAILDQQSRGLNLDSY
ncbi:small ribosomal subunit biogenesis GTPase RsgA [Arenicella xantha]|uniref:Small ribosomal subunit biogenesis GTPase RsgA n=1 Tax=Arenicella xantha TaxID=644221 RepID=A0A395JSE3_9GAMM|nr:small ribosomal subunit biogenesis GTPase RsgA [Arenicella xantha]RBP53272.1 ribosome biogenesis GTPase [Arenicella xantha]